MHLRRPISIVIFAGLALLLASACLPDLESLPREGDLHPRLTRFAYIEEGKLVSFLVDTEATRQREEADFIPFGIGIANIGVDDGLTITRESVTLVDEDGNRYPMATPQEVYGATGSLVADRRLSDSFISAFRIRFDLWPLIQSGFFPVQRSQARLPTERVFLARRSLMTDIVYFPHPKEPIFGRRFEMWLDTEELEEPVFVKLRVR